MNNSQDFKFVDDTNTTVEEDNDDWETPAELYNFLCSTYQIFPKLDICASEKNRKCLDYISREDNALFVDWTIKGKIVDVWANPPGSEQLKFIARAESLYLRQPRNIIMILPTRVMGTITWDRYIEDDYKRKREYHRITGRPQFKKNGKTLGPAMHAYVVVIWRKQSI